MSKELVPPSMLAYDLLKLVAISWGRCRTVRARCAHGACTVRARFNVFGMVAQLVPR